MSKVAEHKKLVDQLRIEASVNPITVSESCKDLINFIQNNQKADALASGVNQNENPYKEVSGCLIS